MRIGLRYITPALAAGVAAVAIAAAPAATAAPSPAQPGPVTTSPVVFATDWHGDHWGHGHGDWHGAWGPWLPWGWGWHR